MKIAFDHQIFCRQSFGGISRYFANLVEHLGHYDAESKVVAPLHVNYYLSKLAPQYVQGKYINRYPKGLKTLATAYNTISAKKMLKNWAPDIVHETFFSKTASLPGTQKTIMTVYDMIPELYPESFRNPSEMALKKASALKRADHVICISENTKMDLLRLLDISEDKVTVVHLGSGLPLASIPSKGELPNIDSPYLMYIGQRGGYKNFTGLMKAIACSTTLRNSVRVVCFGGGAFTASELSEMKQIGLSEKQFVQLGGSDDLLYSLLQHAAAFVFPSLYEGFGIPPLEAMACGCPVVSSDISSMPEVIGSAGEFFNPSEPEDIAASIEKVLSDEHYAQQLVSLGDKRIKQFSWDKCAQETYAVYSRL